MLATGGEQGVEQTPSSSSSIDNGPRSVSDHPTIGSRFAQLFLRGRSLRRLIKHLCNNCPGQVQDPITHVACTMMTSPVSISISEAGVCPFQDHPLLLYPYDMMSVQQRRFLRDLVTHFRDSYKFPKPIGGAPARKPLSSSRHPVPKKKAQASHCPRFCGDENANSDDNAPWHDTGSSLLDLQGSCLVEVPANKPPAHGLGQWTLPPGVIGRGAPLRGAARRGAMYLKVENILESICKCVFSSSVHRNTYRRLAICNILIQRISGALHLTRDSMEKIGEILERLHLETTTGERCTEQEGSQLV